jgi:hypothetical protein
VTTCLDFQSNNELGHSVAMEYENAARRSGRSFLPMYLICDVDENLQRVTSLERANNGMRKVTSHEVLKEIPSRCELLSFDAPEGLRLDVTRLLPTEATKMILAYINLSLEKELKVDSGLC